LKTAIERSRTQAERGRWLLLHLLYARCRCSERILAHLTARKALPDAAERIVMVGADQALAQRARAAGYGVEQLSAEQLQQRYAFSAVPALAIVEPDGRIDYLGGYTERKQGPNVEDVLFYRRARAGARLAALPLFGCAVSQALRRQLDPLSLRSLVLGEK
jgi:thioredoxin-related protein